MTWLSCIAGAVGLAIAAGVSGGLADDSEGFSFIFLGLALAVATDATVGAILMLRRPGNIVGLVLMVAAFVVAGTFLAFIWAAVLTEARGTHDILAGVVSVVAGLGIYPSLIAAGPLLALVFPDGRLPGPRWKWPIGVVVGLLVVGSAMVAVRPGPTGGSLADNPLVISGLPGSDAFWAMGEVIAAAALAFGFVYVHPFVDGNGRLHRWLVHHVLAAMEYAPPGMIFPVSAPMLRELDRYRRVLGSYSRPLLPRIEWRATSSGNVEVLNDTGAFYRYFDATVHAEFLYHCVEETVTHDLPAEVAYLEGYDRFVTAVKQIVDMPQNTVELLHRFLRQNGGVLSERAREKEFNALTEDEVTAIERLYAETSSPGRLP